MATTFGAVNYYLGIHLNINGKEYGAQWYACYETGYRLASVNLSNRTFHNLIGIECYNKIDSIYINSEDQYGVVGFKVDGVEWAKID